MGPICRGLMLRDRSGRSLYVGGAEAQNGAQASPVLLTLSLDAVSDGLPHIFPAGQQQIHEVHIGPRDSSRERKSETGTCSKGAL